MTVQAWFSGGDLDVEPGDSIVLPLTVTNLGNGRSIVVRVNDRGPYSRNRLIDVSSTVASLLDFKRKGTARVQVDYVGPARLDGLDRRMLLATRKPSVRKAAGEWMVSTSATKHWSQ